jgi:large subunit ribosomal protein L22
MKARAIRKYIRSSPRKMRRVVNVVRGQNVAEALNALHFLPQAATRPIELTIKSAVYNLMDQHRDERFDENDLFIQEIRVDEGPMFKRFQPVSRGRAHRIKKRLSHLTVVVGTQDEMEAEEA